jgi:hypothetical protein
MTDSAVFLNGPIGAGKTTLGQALAAELGAGFIDGDDHADPNRAWYGSIKTTSESIVRTGFEILKTCPVVVIAYPLARTNWIYFSRKFGDAGVRTIFVSLRARFERITDPGRGRAFSPAERIRIREMIAEGYGDRAFSDLVVDTDEADFAVTLARLTEGVQALINA